LEIEQQSKLDNRTIEELSVLENNGEAWDYGGEVE
jgi:hypothetical protein